MGKLPHVHKLVTFCLCLHLSLSLNLRLSFVALWPFPSAYTVCVFLFLHVFGLPEHVSPLHSTDRTPASSSFSVPASRRSNWKGSECQPLSACVCMCACAPVRLHALRLYVSVAQTPMSTLHGVSVNLCVYDIFSHFPCLAQLFVTQARILKWN